MSTQLRILGILLVKGAAILASPSLIIGRPAVPRSSSCDANVAAEPVIPATFGFSFFFFSCISMATSFIALNVAKDTPCASNSFVRSNIRCCIYSTSARFSAASSSFDFFVANAFFAWCFLIAASRAAIWYNFIKSSFSIISGKLSGSMPICRIFIFNNMIGKARTSLRCC